MSKEAAEKRVHERFDTEVKIYFQFEYDIKTKVEFQRVNEKLKQASNKYLAYSKNVSTAGICFTSEHRLIVGDNLFLEVYVPGSEIPIAMKGEVKWSQESGGSGYGKSLYDTGVKLITVEGQPVKESIYFDERYQVEWSAVLESVLGSYRKLAQKRKNS